MIAEINIFKERIYYGWIIVGVCFMCWIIADVFGFYTFGMYIEPIGNELGWTTLMITYALTIKQITAAFIGPVSGYLADKKHGPRFVMPVGVLGAASSLFLVSRAQTIWQFYFAYGIVGALGSIGFGGVVTHTLIAKWFIRMRGRAMSIASMGVSVSGLIFIPLNQYLISNYGWRYALLTGSLIVMCVAFLPTVFFIRRRPEDIGMKPDGDHLRSAHTNDNTNPGSNKFGVLEYSWTLRQALRTRSLWLLLVAFNVTGVAFSGAMIHSFPFIETMGITRTTAASAMTLYALVCATVKFPWGLLAEKFPVRNCIIASYAGCALGLAILILFQNKASIFAYAIIYGAGIGGMVVVREILFADYFGRTFLGTIRGVVMPANLISMAGGPVFAAKLYDMTGSYQLAYTVFLFAFIIGIIVMFLAKKPAPSSSLSL